MHAETAADGLRAFAAMHATTETVAKALLDAGEIMRKAGSGVVSFGVVCRSIDALQRHLIPGTASLADFRHYFHRRPAVSRKARRRMRLHRK